MKRRNLLAHLTAHRCAIAMGGIVKDAGLTVEQFRELL